LLLAAPLAPAGVVTEIDIPLLNERPYIEMTLSYLDSQAIPYEAAPDFSYFRIPGGSAWEPISGAVPGDFSSAAFPAAAAAITKGPVSLLGLDPDDTQGDKAFLEFLQKMGCEVTWDQVPIERVPLELYTSVALEAIGKQTIEFHFVEWRLTVSRKGRIKGGVFDLNATPDLLPPLAAVACFAEGDTSLVNVAQARIKETDRIAVMAQELRKLGYETSEREDGLVIHGSKKVPGTGKTDSHGDHRISMALACAALGGSSPVEIAGAECAAISYPGFMELLGVKSL
jgi:3-phosphoshikimate 1-carboxyvinyltransferase